MLYVMKRTNPSFFHEELPDMEMAPPHAALNNPIIIAMKSKTGGRVRRALGPRSSAASPASRANCTMTTSRRLLWKRFRAREGFALRDWLGTQRAVIGCR